MFDIEVLNILAYQDNYDRFSRFVTKSSLSEEAHRIFVCMGKWHKTNPLAKYIHWDKFGPWFLLVEYPKLDPAAAATYRTMFDRLHAMMATAPTGVDAIIDGLIARDAATKAAELLLKVSDGEDISNIDKAISMLDSYSSTLKKKAKLEDSVVSFDIAGVLKTTATGGYDFRLGCLSDAMGKIRQGDFIIFATRPDTGKTTMIASEATYIAEQLPDDRPVLWINNEEAGAKVMKRIVQAALGATSSAMEADPDGIAAKYHALYKRSDKIIIFDRAHIHIKDVEALCEKYNPGLLVFDQLWKIKGFDGESNEVARQTLLFNWGREMAKAWCPVITVHQADGSAEGQKWIDMSQLYGSKTSIQGEADAIITMGRTPDTGNARYLWVPKNKMTGNVPSLRNGRFEIEILPDIARFKEPT